MKSRVTAGQGDPAIGPPATIRVTVTFSQIRYECSEVVGAPLLIAVISCSSGGGKCIIYFDSKTKFPGYAPGKSTYAAVRAGWPRWLKKAELNWKLKRSQCQSKIHGWLYVAKVVCATSSKGLWFNYRWRLDATDERRRRDAARAHMMK